MLQKNENQLTIEMVLHKINFEQGFPIVKTHEKKVIICGLMDQGFGGGLSVYI